MVQNIATLFALQACLLILFVPKIFQMWKLHIKKSESAEPSQSNSGDHSSIPSYCTQEEQRRYELAMSQYGFLCSSKQGEQTAARSRRIAAVMGRKPSIERQILIFLEPALKGPTAYTCTTGTLNGPDSILNNLDNEAQVRHSDDTSIQRRLSLETEGDEDAAIPVLNETHWWLLRAMRQWRPMRVVVVVSLNLVILADVSFIFCFRGRVSQALALKWLFFELSPSVGYQGHGPDMYLQQRHACHQCRALLHAHPLSREKVATTRVQ